MLPHSGLLPTHIILNRLLTDTINMATQQSLVLESKQGDFIISERPIPQLEPGELLVKVQAAGLNPVDWKIQATGFLVESYPAVLGSDVAGDVEQVGEGVEGWAKGDRVLVLPVRGNPVRFIFNTVR